MKQWVRHFKERGRRGQFRTFTTVAGERVHVSRRDNEAWLPPTGVVDRSDVRELKWRERAQ